jgi:hypothetical protein
MELLLFLKRCCNVKAMEDALFIPTTFSVSLLDLVFFLNNSPQEQRTDYMGLPFLDKGDRLQELLSIGVKPAAFENDYILL